MNCSVLCTVVCSSRAAYIVLYAAWYYVPQCHCAKMPLPLYLLNNDVGSGHRSTSLTPITSAMLCYVIDTRNRFVRYLAVPEDICICLQTLVFSVVSESAIWTDYFCLFDSIILLFMTYNAVPNSVTVCRQWLVIRTAIVFTYE